MLTYKGSLDNIDMNDVSVGDIYQNKDTGKVVFYNNDGEFTPLCNIEDASIATPVETTATIALTSSNFGGYVDICSHPREERIVKNTKCNCCDGKLPMEKADDKGLVKCEYCGNWNSIY